MATEIQDKKTPITKEQAIEALWKGWLKYFGSAPTPGCIQILADQWGLETGWGVSMHNYNFGNVKSRPGDGFDFQYFACNELLSKATAERMQASDPKGAKITAYRQDGKCWIWFYPRNEGCRFRAFATAEDGACDHVSLLARHFPAALEAARMENIPLYAHALHRAGYYTADESAYAAGLVACIRSIQRLPVDYDSLPVLGKADLERLDGWLAMSLQKSIDEGLTQMKAHLCVKDDE